MVYHKPVLLEECINGLNIRPEGIYIDLTFGGGGHSLGILEKLGKRGRLLAFDQDKDVNQNVIGDSRFTFICSNFRFLRNFLQYYSIEKVDGVLADLGVSSHQIDTPERGFSFKSDGELDMRMNMSATYSASDILNDYDEKRLANIFRKYGDLKNAKLIAERIVRRREEKRIERTLELVQVLLPLIPAMNRNKTLARIFQSLRIEVNNEMSALEELLEQLPEVMITGGRMAFITYHSVEDRLVKNFFKTGNTAGKIEKDFFGNMKVPFKLVNKTVILPSEAEIATNPRARSARLRIAEKVAYE